MRKRGHYKYSTKTKRSQVAIAKFIQLDSKVKNSTEMDTQILLAHLSMHYLSLSK